MNVATAQSLALAAVIVVFFCSPPDAPAFERYGERLFPVEIEEALARVGEEERARIAALRERILEAQAGIEEAGMKDYVAPVPKAAEYVPYGKGETFSPDDAKLDMAAIRGGEFLMGSPPEEADRCEDESPQRRVRVGPFWMARFETTWNLYEPFTISNRPRNRDGSLQYPQHLENPTPADLVSAPTNPYTEMDFGMGRDGYPAICMTHHAANKFCEWLSYQTGHFYRLPTEAEWEYACRAGTTGAYSCPAEELADFAIFDPDFRRLGYEKIGTRKPNPWGLYDMHGNVMEWCLDQYLPDAYGRWEGETVANPLTMPQTRYPRVARGGSWYDPPEDLRSAWRFFSEFAWQAQDPQLPKSLWYLTDAHWLGFRVVRPLEVPSVEEMIFAWNNSFLEEKRK